MNPKPVIAEQAVAGSGWAMPVMPFVPFVYLSELRKTTGTISPNPRVTIAR